MQQFFESCRKIIWNSTKHKLLNKTIRNELEHKIIFKKPISDGKKVYVTEVVADRVQFLDSRNSGNTISNSTGDDNVSPADFQTDKPIQGAKETNVSDYVFADFGSSIEISDDDIAF